MRWYMATTDGDFENEYGKFHSDEEAISEFLEWQEGEDFSILEIYECANDETLTPTRLIWH